MAYSTDDDLIKFRRDILELGVDNWDEQHDEAELIINRDLQSSWYVDIAKEIGVSDVFDPLLLDADQLLRLSVYKTLEIAYLTLDHEYESDPFFRHRNTFKELYDEELKKLIKSGIRYDWNKDGTFSSIESLTRSPRRVVRI